MKKILYILPLLFLTGCFMKNNDPQVSFDQLTIPTFNLLMQDSVTVFNTDNIPNGKPVVLVLFGLNCPYCHEETNDLLRNMDSLKNVNFYFLTLDSLNKMKAFSAMHKLGNYSNITVGRDYENFFPDFFQNVALPYSVVYDQNREIKAKFKGKVTASRIIKIINETNQASAN